MPGLAGVSVTGHETYSHAWTRLVRPKEEVVCLELSRR